MTSTTPVRPAEPRPAGTARNPWAVLAVLCLGLFMILLDGTIVNMLGAVLQNRVTANITEGVQAIAQIPESLKQKIIAAAGSGPFQMSMPGGSSMPAAAKAMMAKLFESWFTNAIASAFIVAVILAVFGGLCALLLRSHVKDAEASEATAPAPDLNAEAAVAEADSV